MKIIFFIIISSTILLSQSSVDHPRHETKSDWIVLQDDSYEIWIGYYETPNITWCRTISTLPFSIDKIAKIIEDRGNYYNIFDRVSQSRVLSDDIVYIRYDMPFPMSDRDFLVRYTIKKTPDSASYKFQTAKNFDFPIFTSSIRLENAAGEWYLKKIDGSSTQVVYTWNGDLGGSFPSYALTRAWDKQGNEMINWLEESLEELYKD